MKVKTLVIVLVIGSGMNCSQEQISENERQISEIDGMPISEKITEVETDFAGKILDTLSISINKYDQSKRRRFLKKQYWYNGQKIENQDYYDSEEDLFYQESYGLKGELSTKYETKKDINGRIEYALQIIIGETKNDTIRMEYEHEFYKDGEIKSTLIEASVDELMNMEAELKYYQGERPESEIYFTNQDTLNYRIWEYQDDIMIKSVLVNYRSDTTKTIYFMEDEDKITKEEQYKLEVGEYELIRELTHIYTGIDRIKTIENDFREGRKKYIEYRIER